MSPNKPSINPSTNSELEDEIQNINLNQFVHHLNNGSDEEGDDRVFHNGYLPLNQDQDQIYELDNESESEYESTDDENDERRIDSNYCQWNVNVEWIEEDGEEKQSNVQPESSENAEQNEGKTMDNDEQSDDRFKSYLDNQLHSEEIPFQREYDKKECDKKEPNQIHLNEESIDIIKECMKKIKLPCDSIPSWADAIPESSISERLTDFIYKRASK